ncbi:winged helix-turn-helix transcriptional regulator [Candidatus Margulisiibacteriota bacterium]
MNTDTEERIISYIKKHKRVSPKELIDYLAISPRAVFKQLKKLFEKGRIEKIGLPPKVFYSLYERVEIEEEDLLINEEDILIISNNFYLITPLGEEKFGIDAFKYWCERQNLPVNKTAKEYIKTYHKYHKYKQDNLIKGIAKMNTTFSQVFLDKLYYLDFYAIERFGKTKLGQQLLLAKQSQNVRQIRELIKEIEPRLRFLIKKYSIDCLGFIPPTVKREVQIINEMKKYLSFQLPLLNINKIKTPIIIPQKTLNKLNDRVENAKNTIIVEDNRVFENILLIDDAVGSGSTLNETAKQIREKKLCKKLLIGLAITGSFKGFDVISEV